MILEVVAAKVLPIICITEGIPLLDMVRVKSTVQHSKSLLIGQNDPGISTLISPRSS